MNKNDTKKRSLSGCGSSGVASSNPKQLQQQQQQKDQKKKKKKPRHKKNKSNGIINSNESTPPQPTTAAKGESRQQRPGKKTLRRLRHQQRTLSPVEFLPLSARCAEFTGSVKIFNQTPLVKEQEEKDHQLVRIRTCSALPSNDDDDDTSKYCVTNTSTSTTTTPNTTTTTTTTFISVQPLLILDLNGILCHRLRTRQVDTNNNNNDDDDDEAYTYRPSIGRFAHTDIIPRTDLHDFLKFLNQHFCLALWTSAKAKTVKKLLSMLFHDDDDDEMMVRDQFLFVMSQEQCDFVYDDDDGTKNNPNGDDNGPENNKKNKSNTTTTRSDDGSSIGSNSSSSISTSNGRVYKKPLMTKNLSKVWAEYPLWNAENTILMDDTPGKSGPWPENAIHPPALNGRLMTHDDDHGDNNDAVNERRQRIFLEKLVEHWKKNPVETLWGSSGKVPKSNDNNDDDDESGERQSQLSFLRREGPKHNMGW